MIFVRNGQWNLSFSNSIIPIITHFPSENIEIDINTNCHELFPTSQNYIVNLFSDSRNKCFRSIDLPEDSTDTLAAEVISALENMPHLGAPPVVKTTQNVHPITPSISSSTEKTRVETSAERRIDQVPTPNNTELDRISSEPSRISSEPSNHSQDPSDNSTSSASSENGMPILMHISTHPPQVVIFWIKTGFFSNN